MNPFPWVTPGSEKEEKTWNSKHSALSEDKCQVRHTVIDRKLQDIRRDLSPLEGQGNIEGFFNNAENAGKLGSLVEEIRDAMMEYQVFTHKPTMSSASDTRNRLRYSKISTTTAVDSL